MLRAQYNTEFINFENTGRSVSANAEFDVGSNGLQSAITNKLLFGGYIDQATKDRALNHMHGYNQFGINLNYDISAFFGKKPKLTWLVGFKNQEVLNATYTKDAYELMFYGNKPFEGRTANLSNSNINALRFQELKFGALFQRVDTTAKIGISLSFLKGEQLLYVKTNSNSSLYTNSDGTELILQSNFDLALSDTSTRKNVLSFNGVGASADIFFETPYKSKIGTQSVLTVNANNIGFIHWRNNSVQYSSDSTIKFDGYHVNSIFDLKDSTLKKINGDSVLRKATNARHQEFNTNIPTNLVIINKIYFGKKVFALSTGFRQIFHANYKPYFFMEPEYKFIKGRFTVNVHVGYGGYTRLNFGIGLVYATQGWFFKLGSNSIQGYIAPKLAYGQGVFFSVAKKFKQRNS